MRQFLLTIAASMLALSAMAQEPGRISLKDLRAKYADAGSRFLTVDGAEIHYRDEG